MDEFYSWFSGEEYVREKMKSQLLFLQTERLPENFKSFVREIQECFIFQKYIVASVLCRTVLEIAIRDLFDKNELKSENSKYGEDFDLTLYKRMNIMSLVKKFSPYSKAMHDARTDGNSLIHGNRTVDWDTCADMIKKTFFLIHHLYEVN